MSAVLINGRATREALMPALVERIKKLGFTPGLAIIQVGARADSTAFISAKKSFAKKIGVNEKHITLPEFISEKELISKIVECNNDKKIQGIILQLPLPGHISQTNVIEAISPDKDADGLTSLNLKMLLAGTPNVMPATARGIRELLHHNGYVLAGKRVTILGRSLLVGKPIALMCLNENATVTTVHTKSANAIEQIRSSDIVICAVGKPNLVTAEMVREGQIIIDVGINRVAEKTLVGDVDFTAVSNIVSAITPVPGGVGPMTVFGLFENLVDLSTSRL